MPEQTAVQQDLRRFPRHEVRADAALAPLDENQDMNPPVHVTVQDIARTGVMFDADRRLEIGSSWRLKFVHHGHVVATIPVIVRYTKPIADGNHRVGAQFMIEPFVLSFFGVSEHDLRIDEWADASFSPPAA